MKKYFVRIVVLLFLCTFLFSGCAKKDNNKPNTNTEDNKCFEFDKKTGTIVKYLCGKTSKVDMSEYKMLDAEACRDYLVNHYLFDETKALDFCTNDKSQEYSLGYAIANKAIPSKMYIGLEREGIIKINNNDKAISDVVIPSKIDGVKVQAIGSSAFSNMCDTDNPCGDGNMGIKSVIIPDTVTVIKDNAFKDNEIESVIIPPSVTSIGENAFYNNKISKLTLNEGLTYIDAYAFDRNNLTEVIFPSTIQFIGYNAFKINEITNIDFFGDRTLIEFICNPFPKDVDVEGLNFDC